MRAKRQRVEALFAPWGNLLPELQGLVAAAAPLPARVMLSWTAKHEYTLLRVDNYMILAAHWEAARLGWRSVVDAYVGLWRGTAEDCDKVRDMILDAYLKGDYATPVWLYTVAKKRLVAWDWQPPNTIGWANLFATFADTTVAELFLAEKPPPSDKGAKHRFLFWLTYYATQYGNDLILKWLEKTGQLCLCIPGGAFDSDYIVQSVCPSLPK
jgi:hypothetical protein